jgi:hypothetical protein
LHITWLDVGLGITNQQPTKQTNMKYSQSPTAPAWFKADDSKVYASAVLGTSQWNEWYEFASRSEAIDEIGSTFCSQAFIDKFTFWADEYYHSDEIIWDGDSPVNIISLVPATLDEIVEAESRF